MGTVELDRDDRISNKDPRSANNSLLQSGISGSIKILPSFFLYGRLWLPRSAEITVIQMLRDLDPPVDVTKERTILSSATQ